MCIFHIYTRFSFNSHIWGPLPGGSEGQPTLNLAMLGLFFFWSHRRQNSGPGVGQTYIRHKTMFKCTSFSCLHFTGIVTFPVGFLTILEKNDLCLVGHQKRNPKFYQRRDKNSSKFYLFPIGKLTLRSKFLFLDKAFH